MSVPNLTDYNTRMQAHLEACISGSKAMVADQISPNSIPYWVMQTNVTELTRKTRYQLFLTIECQIFLARGGVDSGLINSAQTAMLQDIPTVLNYFHANPEFIVGAYTSNPSHFVGGSLRVVASGQADFTSQSGSVVGTLYTATWYHRQLQTEVS